MTNVVELRRVTIRDIPAMLRRCADDIEAGEYGGVLAMVACMLTDDGAVEVFGWGDTPTDVHSAGILSIGVQTLAASRRGGAP